MKRYSVLGAVLMWGFCLPLSAGTVTIGTIGLTGYTNGTQQTIGVSNLTGDASSGTEDYCHSVTFLSPAVCTALNISDWSMTINYMDEAGPHFVSFGPVAGELVIPPASAYVPYIGTSGGEWTVNQSCPNTDPSCSVSSPVTFPPFPTTVTSAVFSGRIGVGGSTTVTVPTGNVLVGTTFSVNYVPTISSGGLDVGEGYVFYDQAEITLDILDAPPVDTTGGSVPEPSTLSFLLIGAAAGAGRLIRRQNTNIIEP